MAKTKDLLCGPECSICDPQPYDPPTREWEAEEQRRIIQDIQDALARGI